MAIITISRGTFSGGTNLAELLSEKLKCTHITRETLVSIAKDKGVSLKKLSQALDEKPGLLESMAERVHYLTYIQQALAKAIKDEDNVVYDGLAGHLLLKDIPNILRVKVIANMDYRIEAAMERMKFNTRKDAYDFIKNIDNKRDKWTRALYQRDWQDPLLYDLVINLEQMSFNSASEVVYHAASQSEFERTQDMQKEIIDFSLCTDVRAAIAADYTIDDSNIDVEVKDGIVTLEGTIDNLEQAARIKSMVQKIPGVKEIDSRMQKQTGPLDPFQRK